MRFFEKKGLTKSELLTKLQMVRSFFFVLFFENTILQIKVFR